MTKLEALLEIKEAVENSLKTDKDYLPTSEKNIIRELLDDLENLLT